MRIRFIKQRPDRAAQRDRVAQSLAERAALARALPDRTQSGLVYETGLNYHWREDPVVGEKTEKELLALLPGLLVSPYWEDRVRAKYAARAIQHMATMPDGMIAIYEAPESPNLHDRGGTPARGSVWVQHPDPKVLEELLPMYQALWDGYTAQWGPASRRVFALGPVSGARVNVVYLPSVTADEILKRTASRHDMPRHLQQAREARQ